MHQQVQHQFTGVVERHLDLIKILSLFDCVYDLLSIGTLHIQTSKQRTAHCCAKTNQVLKLTGHNNHNTIYIAPCAQLQRRWVASQLGGIQTVAKKKRLQT